MRIYWLMTAALLLVPNGSVAGEMPTAEETVAFILYGVEDGSLLQKSDYLSDTHQIGFVSQTESAPATFAYPAGLSSLKTVTVKEIAPCIFDVSETDDAGQSSSRKYDFDKFAVLTHSGDYWSVRFAGKCPIVNSDGSCSKTGGAFVDYPVPVSRLQMAADFMKREYCAGAPF